MKAIHAAQPLFAWAELEDYPTLATLRDLLQSVPDQPLLDALQTTRGKGRDDVPIPRRWRILLLTIALRHAHSNDTLAQRHRNPSLCRLLDIATADQIARDGNLSRFLDVLGQPTHRNHLHAIFDHLARHLGMAVPDLGRECAGDSTPLNARPKASAKAVAAEGAEGRPQPSGGKKEYHDEEGKVVQVVEWFGYQRHVRVDVAHEVSLAYAVSNPARGDNEVVPPWLRQAQANRPAGRIQTLAYDKAADDEKVQEALHAARVKPLIPNRSLWKEELERPLPGDR
jgi:DDE family transposase